MLFLFNFVTENAHGPPLGTFVFTPHHGGPFVHCTIGKGLYLAVVYPEVLL